MQLLSILILFCVTFSYANPIVQNFKVTPKETCTEKRLDQNQGVMSKIPIHDQNTVNFCWSYAGTQLIDAWRAKYKNPPIPPYSSPTANAYRYLSQKNISDLNTLEPTFGFLKRAKTYPICSHEVVNDRVNGADHQSFFDNMKQLHQLARSGRASEDELDSILNRCLLGIDPMKRVSWRQVSQASMEAETTKFISRVLNEICKPHSKELDSLPDPEMISALDVGDGVRGMHQIQNRINTNLDQKEPLPVSIRFCPDALNRPRAPTLLPNGRLDENNCKDKAGNLRPAHSAVIVGRRPIIYKNNRGEEIHLCQYLIRNSYGTSCQSYPDFNGVFTPSDRCNNGQVWVDEMTLLTNTNEVHWIPDRPR